MKGVARENVIAAFSEEQVGSLTGLTKGRLRYWDRTRFFQPSFGFENRRVAFSRIYSFRDVLALRTLKVLRDQYQVSLQHLRQVGEKLVHLEDDLWTSIQLYVLNRKVHFVNPDTDRVEEVISGQYALGIPLQVIVEHTNRDVTKLHKREKADVGRIDRTRGIRHNAWVISGTRVSVGTIKRYADAGYSIKEIQGEYPHLTQRDIQAAIHYEGDGAAA